MIQKKTIHISVFIIILSGVLIYFFGGEPQHIIDKSIESQYINEIFSRTKTPSMHLNQMSNFHATSRDIFLLEFDVDCEKSIPELYQAKQKNNVLVNTMNDLQQRNTLTDVLLPDIENEFEHVQFSKN